MRLLKFMGKVLAFPVMLIVTAIQWLFTFMEGFSSVVFNLLAGLFLLIAEACPGRVHRLYDPGYRTRDHRRSCRDLGRIIRFYLVVTRKTE